MEKKEGKIKIYTILLVIAFSLIVVTALVIVFLFDYNAYSPSSPKVLDDGQNIYIMAELNDNYKGYRFKFSSEAKTFTMDSENNLINSTDIIEKIGEDEIGSTYNVSICYLGLNTGNNSEYSKSIEWTVCQYIDNPYVYYDAELEKISWNEVENADYYRVFFNGKDEYIETSQTSIDTDNLFGGHRTISVYAYSNNAGYKTKSNARTIEEDIVHHLSKFSSLNFDVDTKIITAYAEEKFEIVGVILSKLYEITNFKVEETGGYFTYTIDISSIYNNEDLIGIRPVSPNEYNIYTEGNEIYYRVSPVE